MPAGAILRKKKKKRSLHLGTRLHLVKKSTLVMLLTEEIDTRRLSSSNLAATYRFPWSYGTLPHSSSCIQQALKTGAAAILDYDLYYLVVHQLCCCFARQWQMSSSPEWRGDEHNSLNYAPSIS